MRDYSKLTTYLRKQTEPVVVLTFSQIERIIEGTLPKSAKEQRAWWSNSKAAHHQARYWIDAHRQATPDFNAGLVRFVVEGITQGVRIEAPRPAGAQAVATLNDCTKSAVVRYLAVSEVIAR